MLANRYKILKIIGEGATSTVYKALDTQNDTGVAVKSRISPSSKNSKMKPRELEMHSQLSHDNIVDLLTCVQSGNNFYLVFELCSHSLVSFINEYDLNMRGIKRIMRMTLLGLWAIHNQGIVHRDIKLSNILVQKDKVKICDFGLSCYVNTLDYANCGTEDYLAPELLQAAKKKAKIRYTDRVDMYALGVVFKILLTRRRDATLRDIEEEFAPEDHMVYDLAYRLLSPDPEYRGSAASALKDPFFKDLISVIPDFRLLRNFEKETKYGVIVRAENYVAIYYNKRSSITFEYRPNACRCSGPFVVSLMVDGEPEEVEFLSETNLKYYNYLCAYLKLLAGRTVKYHLYGDTYSYKYYINGDYYYESDNIAVLKRNEKLHVYVDEEPIDGGLERIRPFYKAKLAELGIRSATLDRIRCVCKEVDFPNTSTTMWSFSMGSEPLVATQKQFLASYGWCIKEGESLEFLLNDGRHFELKAKSGELIFNNVKCEIRPGMSDECEKMLRVARAFLVEMIKGHQ